MRTIPSLVYAAVITVFLAAPPLLWQPWEAQLVPAVYAFIAAFIAALFAQPRLLGSGP
jgi:hypothetical protein